MAAQTLTIETVTVTRTVAGYRTDTHAAVEGIPAPYRLGKRASAAHAAGLAYVRALAIGAHPDTIDGRPSPPRTGVVFVAVLDGKRRQLAAWRAFGLGMTGTHDAHPAILATSSRKRSA